MAATPHDTEVMDKRVACLSPACMRDMGVKLSGPLGKNYKDLASKLNYNVSDVQDFEAKGSPGCILLHTWSMKANSTVAVLRQLLHDMERDDVIRILDAELKDPVDLLVSIRRNSVEILSHMIIKTFGTKTVHETLESCEKVLKLKISLLKLKCTSDYCDETVLQKKAADFKGQQLTFTYDETIPAITRVTTTRHDDTPASDAASATTRPRPLGDDTKLQHLVINHHRDTSQSTGTRPVSYPDNCDSQANKSVRELTSRFEQPAPSEARLQGAVSTKSLPEAVMHTGQVSPAVLKPSSSDAFFNKGSRQESVSPPVAAVLPFGRNASHNTGRHTRGGNVHTRATHVDTRDEAEMTPKELARNPLGARSYTHNAPSYTGGAPSAASSDIEAASRAEAETEPKVIARRAPTYDIPLRSPEPVFFLDPPVSLEYNQSIGSEPSQTFVKSPTTGSEPSDPPDSLKEKPDQSFVSYPYDSSRAERAPNAPPTLTIDDIEDAYMSTTSIGSDADETIPGYYGDATSNRTISRLIRPYVEIDGAYIIRPSRDDPADRSISVVQNREVVNYRIHRYEGRLQDRILFQYFIYQTGPFFDSISELVRHYQASPLDDGNGPGPTLAVPIEMSENEYLQLRDG